jgi:hypothetical protein
MSDNDLGRISALIAAQRALLASVAAGAVDLAVADEEYRRTHAELRILLARRGRACLCPWDSIRAWPHAYANGGYPVDEILDELVRPLGDLIDPAPKPPWTLIYYQAGGDPRRLPFGDFESALSEDEFIVLDQSLQRELAVRGTTSKGHPWGCGGGGHPEPKVWMFKIEEGAPSRRVVLRVFYVPAPERRIALLRGYNKGKDDSDAGERAAARDACVMRADFEAQLGDPSRRQVALRAVR